MLLDPLSTALIFENCVRDGHLKSLSLVNSYICEYNCYQIGQCLLNNTSLRSLNLSMSYKDGASSIDFHTFYPFMDETGLIEEDFNEIFHALKSHPSLTSLTLAEMIYMTILPTL